MGRDRSAELKNMVAGPREESLSSWGMPPPQNRQGKGGLVQENKKLKSQGTFRTQVTALADLERESACLSPDVRVQRQRGPI